MSFQELHIKALENQVVNLTRDCHYLISLLNQTDNIDWENWPQGCKIKDDLDRSKDFFNSSEGFKQKEENLEETRNQINRKIDEDYIDNLFSSTFSSYKNNRKKLICDFIKFLDMYGV